MKNEGGASSINAWDKMGVTWGRGHASGFGNTAELNDKGKPKDGIGVLPRVMMRLVKDPDIARELRRYIAHDLFKIPRPKELKEVDASAE